MSNKRRTKKQKLQASTRHDFSTVLTLNPNSETTTKINIELPITQSEHPTPTARYTRSHAYVIHDIKSTVTITTALLLLNILLHTILTHKIISIPGIGF